jgi:integrase
MTTQLTPREIAAHHIDQALATGIRGDARTLLKDARLLLTASASKGRALTDIECRAIKAGQTLKDPSCPGLSLKNGPRTGTVWVYRFKKPGSNTPQEIKLGTFPEVSLSEARDLWDDARALRANGQNPADQLQPSTASGPLTVEDLVQHYLDAYARKVKRSWAEDERLLKRHLVPVYGTFPATDFGHKEAADLLHRVHETAPREAEKLRACISTVYNFASGRTRKVLVKIPVLPPTHDNPISAVQLPQRQAKNYKPTTQDLTTYVTALEEGSIRQALPLRLQALTMTRIGEVCGLRWDEVDLDTGRWTLPAARAKNGREHLVLLSPQALDLLKAQHEKTGHLDVVFPARGNPSASVSTNGVQNALRSGKEALGLPDGFVSHSLRHAALTWAAEEGCPRDVRDRLTNHVSGGGVDAIYNGAALNQPAHQWWCRWADYLDRLTAKNVVEIGMETGTKTA